MFVSYNRIVGYFISHYAWHLFELFAIRHRSIRIILSRRACNSIASIIESHNRQARLEDAISLTGGAERSGTLG